MTSVPKKAIFICAAKRTAFGKFGGTLVNSTGNDLAVHSSLAAIKAAGLNPNDVDQVVIGNVMQSSKDAAYLARHVALRVGCPDTVPGVTVNRLCASGFEAVAYAARQIQLGEAEVVLAGGTESMSQAPFIVRDIRFGTQLAKPYQFEDALWEGLTDQNIKTPMGVTAEKLGAQYKITRNDCDAFAERSQRRWQLAHSGDVFKAEIAPMEFKTRKGTKVFDTDEHPRGDTTVEGLAKMPPVFKKDGLTCAGSASGVCDGAASLIVASEEACEKYKMEPLARLVGFSTVGVDPTIMGVGPVPAIQQLFKASGLTFKDMELVEINEAFAAQALACQKALLDDGLQPDQLNQNGGAIAIGHPLGASGARISGHIVHELRRRRAKYGLGSACVGGGMGMAMIFENLALA